MNCNLQHNYRLTHVPHLCNKATGRRVTPCKEWLSIFPALTTCLTDLSPRAPYDDERCLTRMEG
jgi:hypothetical protein